MGDEYTRLTCCDSDCAGANRCTQGGVQCQSCGMWFCPVCEDFDERGYCEDCAEEYPAEDDEEQGKTATADIHQRK